MPQSAIGYLLLLMFIPSTLAADLKPEIELDVAMEDSEQYGKIPKVEIQAPLLGMQHLLRARYNEQFREFLWRSAAPFLDAEGLMIFSLRELQTRNVYQFNTRTAELWAKEHLASGEMVYQMGDFIARFHAAAAIIPSVSVGTEVVGTTTRSMRLAGGQNYHVGLRLSNEWWGEPYWGVGWQMQRRDGVNTSRPSIEAGGRLDFGAGGEIKLWSAADQDRQGINLNYDYPLEGRWHLYSGGRYEGGDLGVGLSWWLGLRYAAEPKLNEASGGGRFDPAAISEQLIEMPPYLQQSGIAIAVAVPTPLVSPTPTVDLSIPPVVTPTPTSTSTTPTVTPTNTVPTVLIGP